MQREDPKSLPAFRELERPVVLWVEATGSVDDAPFIGRGLSVVRVDSSAPIDERHFASQMRGARAIIFDGEEKAVGVLENYANRAFAHGLLLVCHSRSTPQRQAFLTIQLRMAAALETTHAGKRTAKAARNWMHWPTAMTADEVAQAISLWMPGPSENNELQPTVFDRNGVRNELDKALGWEEAILIRRAFSDCATLVLTQMAEGFSGTTFRVDATTNRPAPFSSPLPFVLKVDTRHKVESEYSNYWQLVDPAVPFHLRPRVDPSRSFSGYRFGVLVASFVTESDTFLQTVQRGSGQPVLYSLYDSALAGWHAQVATADALRTRNLIDYLSNSARFGIRFDRFEKERGAAVRAQGSTKTPVQLLTQLQRFGESSFRLSPLHGDLHGGNLRARRGDAILLDFYSTCREGPAAFDSAWLEVSTVFSQSVATTADWEATVEDLYQLDWLRKPPPAPIATGALNWLRRMVRQIRLFALAAQASESEYAQVVTYCLLRYSCFCPARDMHRDQRVKAFITAERLIGELSP